MNLALNSLVVVATVLGSWMAFPQARRIARTRSVEGVSATWIGVSLAINGWWLTYGLVAGMWAVVPVSIISLLLYGVMAWFFVRSVGRSALPGLTLGVFGLGMIPLPFLLIALGLERSARVLGVLRRHPVAIMRTGGIVLVLVGLALVTGLWGVWTQSLQGLVGGFEPVV